MATASEGKFGIDHLAKKLDLKPATTRALLRKHKIPKKGKPYSWKNAGELNAVAKKLKS
jgi:hypothetical protein